MSDELPTRDKPKRAVRTRAGTRARKATTDQTPRVTSTPTSSALAEAGRKAPTPFANARQHARRQRHHVAVVLIVCVLGVGASAFVGMTDEGRIDVEKTIEKRNERIRTNTPDARDVGTPTDIVVPVQNTNRGPALVPLPDDQLPKQEVNSSSSATSTASSTSAVASSTDATATSTEVEPIFVTDPVEPVIESEN